jgi:hypothetical protein
MGVDPAWVSEERIRAGDADSKAHSVVVTMAMDAGWNWYVWDIFREQCGRMQLVQEIFRQYKECVINGVHQPPIGIGFQVVDRKYLQEELDRQSFQQGMTLPLYWLSHWDQEGSINKKKRIEGALEGLIRSHKFFIPRGLEWLEDELFQFPRSRTMDGMDAVVNAIKTAPHAPRELQGPITPLDQTSKHIDDLLAGKLRRRKKRWVNAY